MNTYTLLRKIHLYAGLAILTFVSMYFLTGYPMIHGSWFPKPAKIATTRTEQLSYTGPKEPTAYSNYLQETFDLRGKITRQRQLKDGSWVFRYSRPGTTYAAVVAPAGDSVRITTLKENVIETLVAFHRLHGYGDRILYSVWALVHDLAAFSLILFSVTGIYLWYKLTKRRLLGWILLGISYGYAAATVLYLIYAP